MDKVDGLLWGEPASFTEELVLASPLDSTKTFRARQMGTTEVEAFLALPSAQGLPHIHCLLERFSNLRSQLAEAMRVETGFDDVDCLESVDGALSLLETFSATEHPRQQIRTSNPARELALLSQPYGVVLAILPQNAFLFLALSVFLHAQAAGNSVVLRAPSGSPLTASLLAKALQGCGGVSVVNAPAKELVSRFLARKRSGLLHYFGGSPRIPDLASQCAVHGKAFLGDGEGNTWVFVGSQASAIGAANLLVQGSLRYNGQTCTSVNGAVVHPALFDEICHHVIGLVRDLPAVPLFTSDQAAWCRERLVSSGARTVVGAEVNENWMRPSVALEPAKDSLLVREGVFGPALWVARGTQEEFVDLWPRNEFPLCAAVIGSDPNAFLSLPNLARLVVDGDPSIEDPLEPWGAYGRSGIGSVLPWSDKYLRRLQLDGPRTSS